MTPEKTIISFSGGDKKAIEEFMVWLCESGEQQYWEWMDCHGEPTFQTLKYDWKAHTIEAETGDPEVVE